MSSKLNILMTGAGAPGGPGILKALSKGGKFNIHVCDTNSLASGILLNRQSSHVVPAASDPSFIPTILRICLENSINLIFPLVTLELFEFSKNKALFQAHGIKVLVSDYVTLSVLNDKAKVLQHLEKCSIAHPQFRVVKNSEALVKAVHELGYPNAPVVIKPSVGNGSRGIRILDPTVNSFDLLFNHKPNSLYSSLSNIIETIDEQIIPEIVVSEYLPGEELTIDSVICSGEIVEIMVRTREAMRSGISVSGRFIDNPEVESYIRSIIDSFDITSFSGNVGFQVKKSLLGQYLLLESNPRIQGTSVAALGCGVNLPYLAVASALGISVNYEKSLNIYFARFYNEVFHEI